MDNLDEDIGEALSGNSAELRTNLGKRMHIARLLVTDKTVEELGQVASIGHDLVIHTLNQMERDGEVTQLPNHSGPTKYSLTYFGEELISENAVVHDESAQYTHSALWSALSMGQFDPSAHWVVSRKVEPLRVR
jgi:hypothetical protein